MRRLLRRLWDGMPTYYAPSTSRTGLSHKLPLSQMLQIKLTSVEQAHDQLAEYIDVVRDVEHEVPDVLTQAMHELHSMLTYFAPCRYCDGSGLVDRINPVHGGFYSAVECAVCDGDGYDRAIFARNDIYAGKHT